MARSSPSTNPRLRLQGGDEDLPAREPLFERRAKFDSAAARRGAAKRGSDDDDGGPDEYDAGNGGGGGKRQRRGEEDAVYAAAKVSLRRCCAPSCNPRGRTPWLWHGTPGGCRANPSGALWPPSCCAHRTCPCEQRPAGLHERTP